MSGSCPDCGKWSIRGLRECPGCGYANPKALELQKGQKVQVYWKPDLHWHTGTVIDPSKGPAGRIQVEFVSDIGGAPKQVEFDAEGEPGTDATALRVSRKTTTSSSSRAGCMLAALVLLKSIVPFT